MGAEGATGFVAPNPAPPGHRFLVRIPRQRLDVCAKFSVFKQFSELLELPTRDDEPHVYPEGLRPRRPPDRTACPSLTLMGNGSTVTNEKQLSAMRLTPTVHTRDPEKPKVAGPGWELWSSRADRLQIRLAVLRLNRTVGKQRRPVAALPDPGYAGACCRADPVLCPGEIKELSWPCHGYVEQPPLLAEVALSKRYDAVLDAHNDRGANGKTFGCSHAH